MEKTHHAGINSVCNSIKFRHSTLLTRLDFSYLNCLTKSQNFILEQFFRVPDTEAFVGKIFWVIVIVELAVRSSTFAVIINIL